MITPQHLWERLYREAFRGRAAGRLQRMQQVTSQHPLHSDQIRRRYASHLAGLARRMLSRGRQASQIVRDRCGEDHLLFDDAMHQFAMSVRLDLESKDTAVTSDSLREVLQGDDEALRLVCIALGLDTTVSNKAPDTIPRAGRIVDPGGYRLIEPVGTGGQGTVWKAKQVSSAQGTKAPVAIKFPYATALDLQARQRFIRECQQLQRIDDPSVVRYIGHGVDTYLGAFLVMEHLDGAQFSEYAARESDLRRLVTMMRGVAHGVEVLHRRGIIHADISPRNLLVCDSRDGPTCKLVDFGFVHLSDPSATASLAHGHGTPRFVAPEVLAGEAPSAGSDVFSLGRVLELALELAMETHPSAPRLTDQQSEQHRLLREIIVAATDSSTDKRLASARVLAEQLSSWLEFGKSTEPSLPMDRYFYQQQASARTRAKRLATLLAVGLVACIVSGAIALVQRQYALHAARAESSARARANAVLGQSLARALATSPQVDMSSGITDDAKAVVSELSDMLKTPSQLNQTDRKAIRTAAIQLAGETGQYELARSWQLEELAAIAANEQGTPAHISLLRTLGQTEHMLGHADEAERYLSQAIMLGENAGPSLSDELGMSLCALADLNRDLNDLEAARGLVDRAMMLPKSCKFLVWGMTTRAQILRDMDSPDALEAFDNAMAAMQDCSLDVQKLRYSRAILLTDLYADPAKLNEALRETESLANAFLMTFGDKDAQTARVLGLRARALRLASRLDEAFAVAEKAVEVARSADPYELEADANALKALAASQLSHGTALVNGGDGLQGRKLLDQAAISAEAGVAILPDVELYREQRAELHEFAGLARHRAGSYSLAEDHLRKAFLLRNPEDPAKPVAGTPQKLRTSRRLLADAIFAGNPDRAAEARDLLTPVINEAVADPDQGGRANFAPLYVKILEHLGSHEEAAKWKAIIGGP